MFEGPVTGNIPETLDNGEVTPSTFVTAGQLALALTPYSTIEALAAQTAQTATNAAGIQQNTGSISQLEADMVAKLESSDLALALAPYALNATLSSTNAQVAAHGATLTGLQTTL